MQPTNQFFVCLTWISINCTKFVYQKKRDHNRERQREKEREKKQNKTNWANDCVAYPQQTAHLWGAKNRVIIISRWSTMTRTAFHFCVRCCCPFSLARTSPTADYFFFVLFFFHLYVRLSLAGYISSPRNSIPFSVEYLTIIFGLHYRTVYIRMRAAIVLCLCVIHYRVLLACVCMRAHCADRSRVYWLIGSQSMLPTVMIRYVHRIYLDHNALSRALAHKHTHAQHMHTHQTHR